MFIPAGTFISHSRVPSNSKGGGGVSPKNFQGGGKYDWIRLDKSYDFMGGYFGCGFPELTNFEILPKEKIPQRLANERNEK